MLFEIEDDLPARIRAFNIRLGKYAQWIVIISLIAVFCQVQYQQWQYEKEAIRWENANIPIKAC